MCNFSFLQMEGTLLLLKRFDILQTSPLYFSCEMVLCSCAFFRVLCKDFMSVLWCKGSQNASRGQKVYEIAKSVGVISFLVFLNDVKFDIENLIRHAKISFEMRLHLNLNLFMRGETYSIVERRHVLARAFFPMFLEPF